MSISRFTRLFTASAALLALMAMSDSFAAGTVQTALRAACVPNADLEILVNVQKARITPFQKQLKALKEEFKKSMDAEALEAGKQFEMLCKSMGINEDSVTAVIGTVSLRNIKPDDENTKVPGLIAVALKTPVDAAKVRETLIKTAAEEGEELNIELVAQKGVPMLRIKVDPLELPGDLPRNADKVLNDLYLAFPAGGRVVYFGQGEPLKAAIDRMLSGSFIKRSAEITAAKKLVQEGAEGYILFSMPETYREFMDVQAANAGGNPMVTPPLLALAGLKGAALSSVTTDKAKIALTGDFIAPANAIQLKNALDMGLGMVKMQLMNQNGQPMAIANTMKVTAEDTRLTFSFVLTIDDIKQFIAAVNNRMQQGGMGGAPAAGVPAP